MGLRVGLRKPVGARKSEDGSFYLPRFSRSEIHGACPGGPFHGRPFYALSDGVNLFRFRLSDFSISCNLVVPGFDFRFSIFEFRFSDFACAGVLLDGGVLAV